MNPCFFGFLQNGELFCPFTSAWLDSLGSRGQFSGQSHMSHQAVSDNQSLQDRPFSVRSYLGLGRYQSAAWLQSCHVALLLMGPFFCQESAQFLCRKRLVMEVQSLLQAGCGCHTGLSGHSHHIDTSTMDSWPGMPHNPDTGMVAQLCAFGYSCIYTPA